MRTFATVCSFVLLGFLSCTLVAGGKEQPPRKSGAEQGPEDDVERLTVVSGAAPTIRKGTIGSTGQSYVLSGRKGQKVSVDARSASTSLYFNLRPSDSLEALYASDRSASGNTATVELPADGDYRIDVYLVRSAARRGVKASFTLSVALND